MIDEFMKITLIIFLSLTIFGCQKTVHEVEECDCENMGYVKASETNQIIDFTNLLIDEYNFRTNQSLSHLSFYSEVTS